MSTSVAIQHEALTRATSSQSLANYAAIIRGFMAKGLAESEILPRENVFTYNAWKALGRQVRKGEHGVRCLTFITTTNKRTGREERRPWSTTVFHVSQTEKIGAQRQDRPVSNINGYPEVCDDCDRRRTCDSAGQCHECRQKDIDREREYEEQRERETPEPPKLDATAENIPYAGEAESDEAELQAHSDAVHAGRDATPGNVPFAGEDQASRESGLDDAIAALSPDNTWKAAPVNTAELDAFAAAQPYSQPEVIPAPAPKDSAYDRAMRGETINIMDLIAEQSTTREADRQQNLVSKYGANGAARIESKRETLAQHDRRIDREYRAAKRNVQQVFQSKTVDF